MTRLNERIQTPLPIEEAFAYLADFANAAEWDPGVASVRAHRARVRLGWVRAISLGVRRGDRILPMEYRIVDFQRPSRVVLVGSGSGVEATDEIRFEPNGDGTIVDYTADIRLTGLLRVAQPFMGGSFRKIAEDASDGIARTLAERAASAQGRSS